VLREKELETSYTWSRSSLAFRSRPPCAGCRSGDGRLAGGLLGLDGGRRQSDGFDSIWHTKVSFHLMESILEALSPGSRAAPRTRLWTRLTTTGFQTERLHGGGSSGHPQGLDDTIREMVGGRQIGSLSWERDAHPQAVSTRLSSRDERRGVRRLPRSAGAQVAGVSLRLASHRCAPGLRLLYTPISQEAHAESGFDPRSIHAATVSPTSICNRRLMTSAPG